MTREYDDCPDILREYLLYMLTVKGRSKRTVDGYMVDLRNFFRFINQYKKLITINDDMNFNQITITNINIDIIKDISLTDLYEYINFAANENNNSPKTRARKICSIRSFFNHLYNHLKLLDENPAINLEGPSLKKSLPKYLTLEQCISLLNSVSGDYKERDYCIMVFFLNCGMRLSELVGINISDISDNSVRLLGKGNKERIVYLNKACLDALTAYLAYRNTHHIAEQDKKALFLNKNGGRLTGRRVEQIIDFYLEKAGLKNYGFSVHKLRHTAATMMYQKGHVDIRVLQEILGHANLGTTEIYTHLASDQIENAINSNPLSNFVPKKEKDDDKKQDL